MAEANTECELYVDGKCKSSYRNAPCEKCRSDETWFDGKFKRCLIGDVCREGSIFGNECYKLTMDDIEALKRGEVLFDVGEYGTFIMLEQTE